MGSIIQMNLSSDRNESAVQEGTEFYISFYTNVGTMQNVIQSCVVNIPRDYDFRQDGNPRVVHPFPKLRAMVAEAYKPYHVFASDAEDYAAPHLRIVAWSRLDAAQM